MSALSTDSPRKVITIRDINGNLVNVEGNEDVGQVPDFLLIFIITISANFVSDLFPPNIKKTLQEKPWAQHVVAIVFFLVTVVWAQLGKKRTSWLTVIGNTLIAYLWFLMLFQMSTGQFLLIVALTGVIFVISKFSMKSKSARLAELISLVIVIGLTIGITMLRLFRTHRSGGRMPWNELRYNQIHKFKLISNVDV
jgi:hypothetical protein